MNQAFDQDCFKQYWKVLHTFRKTGSKTRTKWKIQDSNHQYSFRKAWKKLIQQKYLTQNENTVRFQLTRKAVIQLGQKYKEQDRQVHQP